MISEIPDLGKKCTFDRCLSGFFRFPVIRPVILILGLLSVTLKSVKPGAALVGSEGQMRSFNSKSADLEIVFPLLFQVNTYERKWAKSRFSLVPADSGGHI